MKRYLLLAAAGLALSACAGADDKPVVAGGAAMAVSFNWCSGTPATQVRAIPAGTKTLHFRLKDHQASDYPHGGGDYPVSGSSVSIPCGGLRSRIYDPPHPPAGQVHDYEWMVTAMDASGKVIGFGSAVRKFPQ